MINFIEKEHYSYEDLLQLVALLRAPDGCPWDSTQDHHSIRRCFLEETAEACEAIDQEDPVHLQEELGDVLYQVVFHADLERDAGHFTMQDVIDGICSKLVARHPALFSDRQPQQNAEQALDSWEKRKSVLNGYTSVTQSMESVCRTLPALWRAEKLRNKAARANYGTKTVQEAAKQLQQANDTLQQAIADGADASAQLGQLLFAAVDTAAHLSADPEAVLHTACETYIRRFAATESAQAALPADNM